MDITIREMLPEEADTAVRLAKKSFMLFDSLFITRPKQALVAVADGEIAGGVFYIMEPCGKKKVGFVSFFFTAPAHQGKGIGKQLCYEVTKLMWSQGCDVLLTFVRDDNVVSWATFAKSGYFRASLPCLVRLIGAGHALLHYVKHTLGFAVGHELYVALPEKDASQQLEKRNTAMQLAAFFLVNIAMMLPIIIRSNIWLSAIGQLAAIFAGTVIAGYIPLLFSKQKWRFRLTNGGMITCIAVNSILMGFYPMIGNWYPERYEHTPTFKRMMAANAIATWGFLLVLMVLPFVISEPAPLLRSAAQIAGFMAVYRCIPLSPFNSYGGGRVFDWNKAVFALLVVVSLALFVFGYF